jgi:hypothetical protein
MPSDQIDPPTNSPAALQNTGQRPWARPLAITTAVLFVISSAFPVVAGLSKNTANFPKWRGRLDVGLAFVLAILTFAIMGLAEGKVNQQARDATYRAIGFCSMASSSCSSYSSWPGTSSFGSIA